jgi:dolichyl-phosphate beta-glucosyltransferase
MKKHKFPKLLLPFLVSILFYWLFFPYLDWLQDSQGARPGQREGPLSLMNLSVVIPAFNEAERLPAMLQEAYDYLQSNPVYKNSFEIVLVSDGSTDKTVQVGKSVFPKIRIIDLPQNQGKGFAVKQGVLASRGKWILMADADGATKFSDLSKLSENAENSSVIFGSRDHMRNAEAVNRRHPIRNLLMRGFHFVVWVLVGTEIKDTQCGFKLFSREAANQIFPNLHLKRWAFDIEIVEICRRLNIQISEIPVTWKEIPGSKLNVITGAIQMLRDILAIRLIYISGLWTVNKT